MLVCLLASALWLNNASHVFAFKRRHKTYKYVINWFMVHVELNVTFIYTSIQAHSAPLSSSVPLSFVLFCPLSISLCPCEQLGHCALWCLPAQVPVTPALPRFSQSHWSWLPWPPLWRHVPTAGPLPSHCLVLSI